MKMSLEETQLFKGTPETAKTKREQLYVKKKGKPTKNQFTRNKPIVRKERIGKATPLREA